MKCVIITIISIAGVLLLAIAGIAIAIVVGVNSILERGTFISDPRTLALMRSNLNPSFIPKWTSDGAYIIFNSHDARKKETYLIDSRGLTLRAIFNYDKPYEGSYSPDIAPNGREIVYSTLRHATALNGGKTRNYELERSNLDGSGRDRLTTNRELDSFPSWSPDGKKIAFVRKTGDETGIYTMNSDGSNEHLIFPFRISEETASGETYRFALEHLTGPIWSLGGEFIAFSVKEHKHVKNPGSKQDLYIARSDGSWSRKVLSQLTLGQKKPISIPSWSPKDEMLAFAVNSQAENAVYVIRPDSTEPTKILENYAGDQLAWSPDGEEIVSSHGFAVKPDGTGLRDIFPPGLSGRVVWSPDGSKIAVSTEDGRLITLNRDGTDLRKLAYVDNKGEIVLADSPEERKSINVGICIREATVFKPVVPESYANPGLVNDCEALLRSRITLDGIASLDWNERQPIDQWEGVIVRGDPPRVTKLVLNTRIFAGAIPIELGLLTALEELDLSHNYLNGGIPPEMAGLTNLRYLSIQGNALSGCVPIELPDLWVQGSGLERCEAANP